MPKIPLELRDCPNRELMIYLDFKYQELNKRHVANAPQAGTIPIGGGEWMDCFFRMEAIGGCLSALRKLKPLDAAIVEGKAASTAAVEIWNARHKKDYTIQRWTETGHDYLGRLIQLFNTRTKQGVKYSA